SSQFSRWLCVVLLVGCNAKLQVDPPASGGDGGVGGKGGAGAPDAGRGPIDHAGESPGSGGDVGGSDVGGSDVAGDSAGGDSGGYGGELCYPLACSAGSGGIESHAGAGGTAPGGGAGGAAPGDLGQACIPGGSSTEADGSPAKTTITTLDRCNGGLACDATKHCVAMPACPQISGPCVVHGVPTGDPYNATVRGIVARTGVTAMAADDTHLYWLEYGTRDGLGNYQHDGTLFSYGLADGELTSLATALPGPYELGVTTGHAYVAVDGGPLIGSPEHAQVLRLPLAGGAAELVQDAVTVGRFTTAGDQAFWAGAGLYTVLPTPGASVSTLVAGIFVTQAAADASAVYYNSGLSPIMSVLQTGSTPSVVVAPFLPSAFALSGDSIYGVEGLATGSFLDTVPKAGGTWIRKRALGDASANNLQIIDDRYFFDGQYYNTPVLYIETGLISSDAPPARLVEVNGNSDLNKQMLWVATQETVFWSDGRAILARAVTGN
ncbi:MAG TPA: hypothetical protein VIK01_00070, partial [Polyangiaceae bacterium]